MKSTYKLIWSEEAKNNLSEIIDYLEERWTEKEISQFLKKLNHQLDLIRHNPKLFPKVNRKGVRKSVLSKQVSIFYKSNRKEINILFIFDTRQNPGKLVFN